jgi:hypothetical protein
VENNEMKVLVKPDRVTESYLAAVEQAAADREAGEQQARHSHQQTHDCAGGRFSTAICHAYCEVGLCGTQFLSAAEQRAQWDANSDRHKRFGQNINSWEAWERSRDRQLAAWSPIVEALLQARDQTWTMSDRAFATCLISLQHSFFQKTLCARKQFFVTKCGELLAIRLAARAYLGAAIAASEEYGASLRHALDTWTCSRSKATTQLSERECQNYLALGFAGGEAITSYDADFRRQLNAADRALTLASNAAAKIEADKIEAARQAINTVVGKEFVAPQSLVQADDIVVDNALGGAAISEN